MKNSIIIKGARANNLKNIDVEIPRNQLTVMTGLSGSGKSSLAFDTIYAEGQRRYVESLSAYARQFLGQMDKPDVDYIEGLSPAISIDQKTTNKNPRSTVGTVTEIYDYFRLLFARIGKPHCPVCHKPITRQTAEQMVDQLMRLPERSKIQILAPVIRGRKGEHHKVLADIGKQGFVRVRIDGEVHELSKNISLDKNKKHTIEVLVDRLIIKEGISSRLNDSLETALKLGSGNVIVDVDGSRILNFSENFACVDCGISLEEITPRMFSFNSPFGACPECMGLGVKVEFDLQLVIPDMNKSLAEGAIVPWSKSPSGYYLQFLRGVADHYGFSFSTPLSELSKYQLDKILYGTGNEKISFRYENIFHQIRNYHTAFEGVIPILNRRYKESTSEAVREEYENYMSEKICPACRGERLRPEALAVTVSDRSINEISAMTVENCRHFFSELNLTEREQIIGRQILKEINQRLGFLLDVGLDYLTLNRASASLSGGEAQRIRLATQIGSGLVGVLYILDEPSIGLHQRDNQKLIETLMHLRDLGNTLIVVEHDEETIRSADHLIDIGPGAGSNGGEIVAQGTVDDLIAAEESISGQYLSGKRFVPLPLLRRPGNGHMLEVLGAQEHNLKNIDVSFPLGTFICVTGVSGSGKSTLVNEILYPELAHKLHRANTRGGKHRKIRGIEYLDKVINIDQSPIGRTPRSNAATYTGVFNDIRELFAQVPESKMRGYKPGRYSFNVKGGRCEACKGDGIIKIEMHFLPDVYVPCEVCRGKRYNRETLEVLYKGNSIADVLDMIVDEAVTFFEHLPRIHRKLKTLQDVGLGYIKLGQPATTLSGGEAQRVKLATELSRRTNGRTLYILDEPTTGLHIDDIRKLLLILNRLVEAGDTVLVIEHNLDVIKTADYIIDMGPEGGNRGGQIVARGTPEEIADTSSSYTGYYLKRMLNIG